MGSKQLYQCLRASSLYKQQAHQLRGEQQHKGAELGAEGDHCLFQRVCHQWAGHTSTCNYFRGLWRCSFAWDTDENGKPQTAQNWQFQSCSCEETSPFSFPLPRVTDRQQGPEAFKPPAPQLSQPGNLGHAQSQAEGTHKAGTGTLRKLGTGSLQGDMVTPEESQGCLVAASALLAGVRCPVQAWGGKSNSNHGIGTASQQVIIFLPLPDLSLLVPKPHLPQHVPQPSLFLFSPQRPQLNMQLEIHSNYSKTTFQLEKKNVLHTAI